MAFEETEMIHAAIYGRLGRDPKTRTTAAGKAMAYTILAVDATPNNAEEQETLWISVLAFGRQAETLARHTKGEMMAVMGRLTQSRWTTQEGQERTTLNLVAESIVSSRTVRPGGRRKQAGEFKDDPIPF